MPPDRHNLPGWLTHTVIEVHLLTPGAKKNNVQQIYNLFRGTVQSQNVFRTDVLILRAAANNAKLHRAMIRQNTETPPAPLLTRGETAREVKKCNQGPSPGDCRAQEVLESQTSNSESLI